MNVTVETDRPDAPARKTRERRRAEFREHVARTVTRLQEQLLRDPPVPEAVSALARLRRAIGRSPGFDYTLEQYLSVPEELFEYRPRGDEAADAEYAAHDAVTLYALHQQSRRERMHVPGRGLGQALAELVRVADGPDGVRRRFAALGTASTYAESIYHLRGLVMLLREKQVGLDYGRLADDLHTLRQPTGQRRIQAIWGREFFRRRANSTNTDDRATELSEEQPS